MIDLSIIIVTYKGWKRLEKCLGSLDPITGEAFSSEVIITDNTPDPEEIKPVKQRFPRFTYIHNPVNGGFGNGSNTGAGKASGKYLLFLNPDTVIKEQELKRFLRKAVDNPGFMIMSCRQVNERGKECIVTGQFPAFSNLTGFMRAISGQKRRAIPPVIEVVFPDWVSGSVILVSRENFRLLGGFDEDFWMYYEDVDLCRRAFNAGGKVALFGDITIEHNHGGSSRADIKTTSLTKTEVLISRHVYISKHKSGSGRAFLQTFLIMNNLITGLAMAVPGILFYFIPGFRVRAMIFMRLLGYYSSSLFRSSWLSPRSVRFSRHI